MKKSMIILFTVVSLASCKKDFLEIKPDKKLAIPSTLDDFEALLDYSDLMNRWLPSMGDIQADDYSWDYNGWLSSSTPEYKNGYVWNKDIYEGEPSIADWNFSYQIVFQANNVLDGLNKLYLDSTEGRSNLLKGRALFFRAFTFYQVAQLYCATYDKANDNAGLGIPLRLSSDINIVSTRPTIKETYDQILNDLLHAENLMPLVETIKTRPSKTAVWAMLSRVYLTMQDYDNALKYADLVINNGNYSLIDFSKVNPSLSYPMKRFNEEVVFHSLMSSGGPIALARINIDSTLFRSYEEQDLRKKAWFRLLSGLWRFKGSYDGSAQYFNGLALDECYLTKAECLVRNGKYNEGIQVLNSFLSTRYIDFIPTVSNGADEALGIILLERRKELLLRGIRWTDLRRLNLDSKTAKTLVRNLNGTIYKLLPNSRNYVLPIQPDVIRLTNMPQNPRE